mmetsp:Transcript_30655/g.98784  ORF Transcript_30655/g.98784 Transcript_30655/m.98784 type:complete len:297 (-) Transcript_30655:32-922(-)
MREECIHHAHHRSLEDAAGFACDWVVELVVLGELGSEDGLCEPLVVGEGVASLLGLFFFRVVVVVDVDAGNFVEPGVVVVDDVVFVGAHHKADEDVGPLGLDGLLEVGEGAVARDAVGEDEQEDVGFLRVEGAVEDGGAVRQEGRRPPGLASPEGGVDVVGDLDGVDRGVVQELQRKAVRVVDDEEHLREALERAPELVPARLPSAGDAVHRPRVVRDDVDVAPRHLQQVLHHVLGDVQLVLHPPDALRQRQLRRHHGVLRHHAHHRRFRGHFLRGEGAPNACLSPTEEANCRQRW